MSRPKTELDAMLADHDPDAWRMAGDWCEEQGMEVEAKRCRLMAELADRMYPLMRQAIEEQDTNFYLECADIGDGVYVRVKTTSDCVFAYHVVADRGGGSAKGFPLTWLIVPVCFVDRFEEDGKAQLHAYVCKLADTILARGDS